MVPHAMVMTGTGFRTEDLDQDVLDQLESIGMERSEVIDSVLHSTYDGIFGLYLYLETNFGYRFRCSVFLVSIKETEGGRE